MYIIKYKHFSGCICGNYRFTLLESWFAYSSDVSPRKFPLCFQHNKSTHKKLQTPLRPTHRRRALLQSTSTRWHSALRFQLNAVYLRFELRIECAGHLKLNAVYLRFEPSKCTRLWLSPSASLRTSGGDLDEQIWSACSFVALWFGQRVRVWHCGLFQTRSHENRDPLSRVDTLKNVRVFVGGLKMGP